MLDHLRLVLATLPSLCCFCCNCWRPNLTDDNSASLSASSCRFQLKDLRASPRVPAMLRTSGCILTLDWAPTTEIQKHEVC